MKGLAEAAIEGQLWQGNDIHKTQDQVCQRSYQLQQEERPNVQHYQAV